MMISKRSAGATIRHRLLAALVFLFAAIGSGSGAFADEAVPDAPTLEARMAAAIGPDNVNYRSTVVESNADGDALIEHAHRGADSLTTVTRGKMRTVSGTANGASWNQDPNGVTVADTPDPGAAARAKVKTTVQRASSPRDTYVLSVIDEDGFGHRDYVDPATYLVERRDDIDADGTSTTTYGPYQRYGTQLMAASWHVDDGAGQPSVMYTRKSFAAGVATEADVAVPPVRQLVSFPANATSVDLHATFSHDSSLITVPVTIGGRQLYFMIDTGSSVLTIDSHIAEILGLEKIGHDHVTGVSTANVGDVLIPAIHIGGLEMRDVVATSFSFGSGRSPTDPAGILGFDFLAELIVNVDNARQRVVVSDPRTFSAPVGRNVDALPIRLGGGIPMISMNVGGATAERMVVDSGSDDGLLLFSYFVRRHSGIFINRPNDDALRSIDPTPHYGFVDGVGGEAATRRTTVPFIHLGHYSISEVSVDVINSRHSFAWDTDGLLGRSFLRVFNLIYDYADGMIYLWPATGGP